MAKGFNIGVSAIEIGDVSPTGMGEDLKALGLTQRGTCKFNTEEGEVTEFFVEEFDPAWESMSKEGSSTLVMTVANPVLETLVSVWGGKIDAQTKKYSRPRVLPDKEVCVKLTPRKGIGFDFFRAKMTAIFTSDVGIETNLGISVTFKIMLPDNEDLGLFDNFIVE